MLIGEVVRRSGVSRDTIRYYERLGLIRTEGPSAPTNSYKMYATDTLTRLELIRQGKKLGFSLTEIIDGLDLLSNEQLSDVAAENRLVNKIKTIDQKIQALQAVRHRLNFVLERIHEGTCSLQLPQAERDETRKMADG